MLKKLFFIGVIMCSAAAITRPKEKPHAKLTLISPDIKQGKPIPEIHSLKAGNKPPKLSWSGAPEGTESFVLIVDDPDAPGKTWVHWVVFNIPADMTSVPNLLRKKELPNGIKQGKTDFKEIGYDGPYPPFGPAHRYFFKVYALDTTLDIPAGSTKAAVEKAMKGHVVAQGEIMGTYQQKSVAANAKG